MSGSDDGWAGLAFTPPWRHYQRMALAAFDADLAARRRATHIVAPPGSGKTVIGLEIARRLGRPALVLCPTTAIQQQWGSALGLFGGAEAPLLTHTYQAICQTADPGGALEAAALERLAAERARDTAIGVEAARAELDGYEGAARRRLTRDVATVTATLKREIARGEHLDLAAHDLLGPGAAARLAELQARGVRTVLLDECHHLVSTWGYLVRAVIAALGDDVHVVGLTATSPLDLSGEEAALYDDLLGEVDFEIPTPAVVKEGYLAPYQELALFTTPLASEREWLQQHHARFQALLDRLHDPAPPGSAEEELSFGAWVIARIRYRDAEAGESSSFSFAAFAKRQPRLARAGLRYLGSAGLELPPDAPRGELTSAPPELDDWLALLDDWALRCLRAHPGEAAERLWEQLAGGLADIGFTLTRRGIRPGRDDLDRVLVNSSAKTLLVADALDAEHAVRGAGLRAVVLCDSERPARAPEETALTLGGGLALLSALAADDRTALLHPLLVTGTTVACAPADAEGWLAALAAELPPEVAATLRVEPLGGDAPLARLTADHAGWSTATYVPAVTRAFAGDGPHAAGRVLIGTRALLGEGWDCPPVNVLVDCTAVAASVSVRQMRGRSLRLDPGDDGKISSNWDVVCVAPELERGAADYHRFVRRHSHLHAPCEDGSIESGVSHVHPQLSPYAPPPEEQFTALNLAALDRAADLDSARERWQIGAPYRGEELPVLLVGAARERPGSGTAAPGTSAHGAAAASGTSAPGTLTIDPAPDPARPLPATGRLPGLAAVAASLVALAAAAAGSASAAVAAATVGDVALALALWQAA
ncbi:DEAD/DEAH box helicase family protein, partial [Conexibacter stalactiti]